MAGSAEAFQRSITLDPYNAEAYHQYGQALTGLGRYTEALAAYRRVVDLEPDRAMTLVPMAAIHGRLGRPFEGLRLMDSAISASPNVPYARATRSLFRAETGDIPGAKEDAEFALSLDPAYPVPALAALVKSLWMSGDTLQALSRLRQAEAAVLDKSHPSYTEAYWLSIGEVAAGRSDKALELLTNVRPQGAWTWFLFQGSEFVEFRKIPAVAARLAAIDPRRPTR
jgi:tetratricopeptide (TPR) repeat protein